MKLRSRWFHLTLYTMEIDHQNVGCGAAVIIVEAVVVIVRHKVSKPY